MGKVLRFGVSRALLLAPMSAAMLMGCGDDLRGKTICSDEVGGPVYPGCPIVNPASAFERPEMGQMSDAGSAGDMVDEADLSADQDGLDEGVDQAADQGSAEDM